MILSGFLPLYHLTSPSTNVIANYLPVVVSIVEYLLMSLFLIFITGLKHVPSSWPLNMVTAAVTFFLAVDPVLVGLL